MASNRNENDGAYEFSLDISNKKKIYKKIWKFIYLLDMSNENPWTRSFSSLTSNVTVIRGKMFLSQRFKVQILSLMSNELVIKDSQ